MGQEIEGEYQYIIAALGEEYRQTLREEQFGLIVAKQGRRFLKRSIMYSSFLRLAQFVYQSIPFCFSWYICLIHGKFKCRALVFR